MPQQPGGPGAPVEDLTQRGYGPPFCTQFSVFLPNRVGKLYELLDRFDPQPIRIVALSVVDASDHAVVRIVTTRADATRELLSEYHFPFTESNILVVELGADQRLTRLCIALLTAELNIDYAYPLMVRPHGAATLAVRTDDPHLAGQILIRKGFVILGEGELRDAAGGDPDL